MPTMKRKTITILGTTEPVMEAHRILLAAKRPEDMHVRVTIKTPTRTAILTARRADLPDSDSHLLDGVREIALHWRTPDGHIYPSRAAMIKNIEGRTFKATGYNVAVLADGTAVPVEMEGTEHTAAEHTAFMAVLADDRAAEHGAMLQETAKDVQTIKKCLPAIIESNDRESDETAEIAAKIKLGLNSTEQVVHDLLQDGMDQSRIARELKARKRKPNSQASVSRMQVTIKRRYAEKGLHFRQRARGSGAPIPATLGGTDVDTHAVAFEDTDTPDRSALIGVQQRTPADDAEQSDMDKYVDAWKKAETKEDKQKYEREIEGLHEELVRRKMLCA